jgi:RNA 2',3'-cyclic 3'-phosphodiesterase
MIRTFLAVELSEPLRTNLSKLQQELKQRLARELSGDVRISWVQPTSIHLTIKFLGDIDEQLVAPMHNAMSDVVQGHHRIDIPLERFGVFPRPQQPRVLWVGPSEPWEQDEDAKRLALLHQAIEACCRALDFAPETRPLSPHLTLARIKEGGRSMGQVLAKSGMMDRALALGSFAVDAIVLIKSVLQPTGPLYTTLWRSRLGPGPV